MKVVHLSSVHPPFDSRIFYKECRTLVKNGHDVVLVVQHDQDEIVDGVQIRAVSKPANRFKRIFRTTWKIYKTCLEENASIYHFHDPELIPIALLLKTKGKKVIYDVHEDVPRQILGKYYLPDFSKPIISRCIEAIEMFASKRFSAICCATAHIRNRFLPVNNNSFNINNFPSLEEFNFPITNWNDRQNKICYIGAISATRGIEELIDAMAMIDAELDLLGNYFPCSFRDRLLASKGWQKVNELGFQDRAGVKSVLATSKVGIVTLHPTHSYIKALPVKMFEYMAAGIPVVASDFPLWREIIDGSKCGICVNPKNPDAISDAVSYLLNNDLEAETMGLNGRKAVENVFNWKNEEVKLLKLYQRLK